MASASLSPPSFRHALLSKSQFLGQNNIRILPQRSISSTCHRTVKVKPPISAKFNLFEVLGGRGLCNGEAGLQEELKKDTQKPPQSTPPGDEEAQGTETENSVSKLEGVAEDGFEKELLGLTGGFPGGEKGLQKFLEKNPPPPKKEDESEQVRSILSSAKKPKPPELPLLLPGMIAIVKNPNNPFYMYCGIVQRITDGKAGVLFEGGNWDRLVTFRLEELERREKGPPMVNPKSAILEPMIEMLQKK